jgi:arabinose-5-phosphate isomerase
MERTAADIMTRNPLTVVPGTLAVEVLNVFEQRKITSIVVVGADNRIEGVVHLHDLWRTEVF